MVRLVTSIYLPLTTAKDANLSFLFDLKGLSANGLFRIPGQTKTVNALYKHFMTQLENGRNGPFQVEVTIANPTLPTHIPFTVHDLTSLYKKFLAGVDGGILGSVTLFNAIKKVIEPAGVCIENLYTASSIINASQIAEILLETASRDRYYLITAVFGLLAYIKEDEGDFDDVEGKKKRDPAQSQEKMSSKALGVVFAPLLLGNKTDGIEIESLGKDQEFQQFTKLTANVSKAKSTQVTELITGMARAELAGLIIEILILQWDNIACFLRSKTELYGRGGSGFTQLNVAKKRSLNTISGSRDVSENWPLVTNKKKNSSLTRSISTNFVETGRKYRHNKGDRTTSLLMFPKGYATLNDYNAEFLSDDSEWEEPSDFSAIGRLAKKYMEEYENPTEEDKSLTAWILSMAPKPEEEKVQTASEIEVKVETEKKLTDRFGEDEAEKRLMKLNEEKEDDEAKKKQDTESGECEETGETGDNGNIAADISNHIQLPGKPAPATNRRPSRSSFSRIPRRSVDGLRSRGSTISSSSSKNSLKSVPEECEPFPPLYGETQVESSNNIQRPATPWRCYRNITHGSQISLASTDRWDDSILVSVSQRDERRASVGQHSSRIPRFRHMATGSTASSEINTPSSFARRERIGLTVATPSRLNRVYSHADELLHHVSELPSEISIKDRSGKLMIGCCDRLLLTSSAACPSVENRSRLTSSQLNEMPRAARAGSVTSEISVNSADFEAIGLPGGLEMGNESLADGQNSKMSALYAELHKTQRELAREKHRSSKLEQDLDAVRRAKGSAFFIERLKEAESQIKQWRERAERAEISCLRQDHEQAGVIQSFVEKRLEARKTASSGSKTSESSSDGRNRDRRGRSVGVGLRR